MTNVDIGANLVTNPSLKTTTSGWYNSNGTVTKTSVGGRFQLSVGASSAAYAKMTVVAGRKYALTGVRYRKVSGTALFGVGLYFYNSAGTQVGSATTWNAPAATVGVWNTAPRLEATAPAGAVTMRLYVRQAATTVAFDYYATNFILKRYVLAPTINAGADQTKVQGESATLNATVTPGDGSIVKTEWYETRSGINGGYTTTYPNPRTVGPYASIGTYYYNVRTTDSFGVVAADSMTVTVGAGPAPVVTTGPAQTIYVGATANLTGSATSVAGIASWAWTEVSTSGTTITSPTAQNTAVGPFTFPGVYTFQLKATDVNAKAGTDTVVVTVLPVPESYAINDRTRLEVLADDVENEITNHSAQDGTTTGWGSAYTLTATSGNSFGTDGNALKVSRSYPYVSAFNTQTGSANGGSWVSGEITIYHEYTAAPILLGGYLDYGNGSASGSFDVEESVVPPFVPFVLKVPAFQLPLGFGNDYEFFILFYAYSDPVVASTLGVYFYGAQILSGPSEAAVKDIPFSTDEDWQNLLGTATSVSTSRGARIEGVTDSLEAGLLTAVIPDPNLTPDNNPRMRPGRTIRLSAFNTIDAEWQPVWTGSISECNVTYRDKRPVVTISATDAVTDLSNTPQAIGMSGALRQRVNAIMDGSPILYQVTDTDPDTTSAVITVEDQGTALTQLEMMRNSLHGFVYVDKTNTVQAIASNSAPSTSPVVTFSDDPLDSLAIEYTDIDTNFGSKALVNSLNVEKHDAQGENGQYTYGPYLNAESIANWHEQSATLVINSGDPVTQAEYYLSTFANPEIFCNSVTFRADNNLGPAVELELYQAARVKFSNAGLDDVYRIIGIEHDVLPDSWTTRVFFRPLEATETIVVQVPALGAYTGPSDLLPPKPVGTVTATSPFATTVTLTRIGNLVFPTGGFTRASGFSTSFTAAGTIPDGFKPAVAYADTQPFFNSAATWNMSINTSGAVSIRMSAANTGSMVPNAPWITTDPYPA